MKRIAVLLVAAVLAGCAGTNFEWSNARQLKTGMSQEEVTSLMGKPYSVTSANGRTIWVWSYASSFGGHKTLAVPFVDGKLAATPEIPDAF